MPTLREAIKYYYDYVIGHGGSTPPVPIDGGPFQKLLQDDLENIYDAGEFAVAATYTPVSGAAKSITVMPDYGAQETEIDWQAKDARVAIIGVMVIDVLNPVANDCIAIGADNWMVTGIVAGDGYEWKLAAVHRG